MVRGIAVGANGEWPRGAGTLISNAVRAGSANSECPSCCHGQEQAQRVIAAMDRSRLGRAALRGAAQVRVAALLTITGQPGTDPGNSRRGARGTQGEWDRTRGDAFAPRAG